MNNTTEMKPKYVMNEALKEYKIIYGNRTYIFYKGTLVDGGKYSREIKNPICEILNEKNEIEYLMLCNQDILCKMCPRSYQAIRDFEKKHNYDRPINWTYNEKTR